MTHTIKNQKQKPTVKTIWLGRVIGLRATQKTPAPSSNTHKYFMVASKLPAPPFQQPFLYT